jgi:hypothetical protein
MQINCPNVKNTTKLYLIFYIKSLILCTMLSEHGMLSIYHNSYPSSWLLLLAVALCPVPAPHRPWLAHAAIAAENTGDIMIEGDQ